MPLARLTADIPAVRAGFKESEDDFEVDEVPRDAPGALVAGGSGPHLWIRIEKRGISTDEAVRRLAAALGRRERELGFAGRKDARGVARQWLSIEGLAPAEAAGALREDAALRILEAVPAGRRLGLGDLAGNRFVVRLRDVSETDERRAREVLARLLLTGVPNYFGPQRFGIRGNSDAIGRALLLGDARRAIDLLLGAPHPDEGPRLKEARAAYERGDLPAALAAFPASFVPERRLAQALLRGAPPERALESIAFRVRELYISAYQAALFNRILDDRVRAGTLGAIERGDIALDHASGALVLVEDPRPFALRVQRLEVSATGPIYGHAAPRPRWGPGARELDLLVKEGLRYETWARPKGLSMKGTRRALRFILKELAVAREEGDLVLRFFLGPGSYATAVVDELLKR